MQINSSSTARPSIRDNFQRAGEAGRARVAKASDNKAKAAGKKGVARSVWLRARAVLRLFDPDHRMVARLLRELTARPYLWRSSMSAVMGGQEVWWSSEERLSA